MSKPFKVHYKHNLRQEINIGLKVNVHLKKEDRYLSSL